MKFPKLLPLALLAATLSGTAMADCASPDLSLKIPDGSKASKEELLVAKKSLADLNTAVVTYQSCMEAERDAKLAAGGDKLDDAAKAKIQEDYAKAGNTAVDKLQKLADKFNLEVRAWKAKQPSAPSTPPAQ